MKHVIAVACALLTGIILMALSVREGPRRAAPVPDSPAPPAPRQEAPRAADEAALALEAEVQRAGRRVAEREKAVERLESDYEARIERLIESIDWSRAESRIRFPIESAIIRADFESSLERLGRDGTEE